MNQRRFVILLALLVRGGVLLLAPGALAADPDGYRQIARNLLEHGTLGHGPVPTAFRPPLYPLAVAVCELADPYDREALGLLHVGLGLATVWLVLRLGQRCGLGRWSVLAAALVACDPILLWQSTMVMTETAATFLAVAAIAALTEAACRPTIARAGLAGGLLGLAGLCRPELLVWGGLAAVLLPWVAGKAATEPVGNALHGVPWFRRFCGTPRRAFPTGAPTGAAHTRCIARLRLLVALIAVAGVVLTPWAVRNWRCFGSPVVTTTHGGYTLLLGNNPDCYRDLRERGAGGVWDAQRFHESWARRRLDVAPSDELAADRLAYADARETIAREPGMFLRASIARVGRLWQLVPRRIAADKSAWWTAARYAVGGWYLVELLAAGVGVTVVTLGRSGGARLRMVLLWGGVLAGSLTAVHAVYWTDMRMRAPLMPAIALAAAAGVVWLRGLLAHGLPTVPRLRP